MRLVVQIDVLHCGERNGVTHRRRSASMHVFLPPSINDFAQLGRTDERTDESFDRAAVIDTSSQTDFLLSLATFHAALSLASNALNSVANLTRRRRQQQRLELHQLLTNWPPYKNSSPLRSFRSIIDAFKTYFDAKCV